MCLFYSMCNDECGLKQGRKFEDYTSSENVKIYRLNMNKTWKNRNQDKFKKYFARHCFREVQESAYGPNFPVASLAFGFTVYSLLVYSSIHRSTEGIIQLKTCWAQDFSNYLKTGTKYFVLAISRWQEYVLFKKSTWCSPLFIWKNSQNINHNKVVSG